jgi:hypothetical protein
VHLTKAIRVNSVGDNCLISGAKIVTENNTKTYTQLFYLESGATNVVITGVNIEKGGTDTITNSVQDDQLSTTLSYVSTFNEYSQTGHLNQIIQIVYTEDGDVATGTTVLPFDNTIPQNTEGDQYLSQAITPKDSNNLLEIEAVLHLSSGAAGTQMSAALFKDSTANALAAAWGGRNNSADSITQVVLKHRVTAGSTSAITFKIRAGFSGAGTTTFNGQSSARIFADVAASYIKITEYQK